MRKLLFVAYHFPPIRHSATVRILKFSKYLPQFGWHPYILTINTPQKNNDEFEGIRKEDIYRSFLFHPRRIAKQLLLKRYESLTHQRDKYIEPSPGWLKRLSRTISGWILIPDEAILWFPGATRLGRKIIQEKNIDVILTTSGPYSVSLIGLWLKRKCKLPWLADFRDNWTRLGTDIYQPTPFHSWIHQSFERQVFYHADCVTSVQPDLYVGGDNNIHRKIKHLTNGFDPDDFPTDIKIDNNKKFRIVYAGSFYGDRKPDNFIKAISSLLDSNPKLRDDFEIDLYGSSAETFISRKLEELQLSKIVKLKGNIPHDQILSELQNADLLLLILPNHQKTVYSGKLFEYLGSNRPILGLVPTDGVAAEIIEDTKSGIVVDPEDLSAIEDTIYGYYNQWRNGELTHFLSENTDKYSYTQIVPRLAKYLDEIYDTNPKTKI